MSFNTVVDAANDHELQQRITASVQNEALNNPDLKETQFAAQVRNGFINLTSMYWAVANAVQAAYEGGVLSGRGAPGHDQDVVTDESIVQAVIAAWPPDPEVINPAGMMPR